MRVGSGVSVFVVATTHRGRRSTKEPKLDYLDDKSDKLMLSRKIPWRRPGRKATKINVQEITNFRPTSRARTGNKHIASDV